MDITEKGSHIPFIKETKEGVKTGVIKKTPKHQITKEDKQFFSLDVRDRATIGKSLP